MKNLKVKAAFELAQKNLEKAIVDLLYQDRFYASLVMNLGTEITTKVPHAAVNIKDAGPIMMNPFYFNSISREERQGVLEHECLHVLEGHWERQLHLIPNLLKPENGSEAFNNTQKQHIFNLAADYAINQLIPEKNLPKEVTFFTENGEQILEPSDIELENGKKVKNEKAGLAVSGQTCIFSELQKKYPNVLARQSTEYYYHFLMQNMPKQEVELLKTLDDHDSWETDENEGANNEMVKSKIKDLINRTVQQCAGKVSNSILQKLDRLNSSTCNWRSILQQFATSAQNIELEYSKTKRSRRYRDRLDIPGIKKYPKLHLAALFDTSGSMGSEECDQIWAELKKIHQTGAEITVIQCDSEVQDVSTFDPKKIPEIKGRGGTSFNPALERAKELDADLIVYFTDGDNYDQYEVKKPRQPMLWGVTSGGTIRYPWGKKIQVKINK